MSITVCAQLTVAYTTSECLPTSRGAKKVIRKIIENNIFVPVDERHKVASTQI